MDRLAGAEELLDGPLDDRAALIGNLRDLARVNRRLGGAGLSARAIDDLAPGRSSIAVLDIGTGAADIPLALIERGRAAGRLVRVTGVDSRPEVLEAAALIDPRVTAPRRDLPYDPERVAPEEVMSRLIFRAHQDMVRGAWVRGRRLEGPAEPAS